VCIGIDIDKGLDIASPAAAPTAGLAEGACGRATQAQAGMRRCNILFYSSIDLYVYIYVRLCV